MLNFTQQSSWKTKPVSAHVMRQYIQLWKGLAHTSWWHDRSSAYEAVCRVCVVVSKLYICIQCTNIDSVTCGQSLHVALFSTDMHAGVCMCMSTRVGVDVFSPFHFSGSRWDLFLDFVSPFLLLRWIICALKIPTQTASEITLTPRFLPSPQATEIHLWILNQTGVKCVWDLKVVLIKFTNQKKDVIRNQSDLNLFWVSTTTKKEAKKRPLLVFLVTTHF